MPAQEELVLAVVYAFTFQNKNFLKSRTFDPGSRACFLEADH